MTTSSLLSLDVNFLFIVPFGKIETAIIFIPQSMHGNYFMLSAAIAPLVALLPSFVSQ
jgi:hypothetical protein